MLISRIALALTFAPIAQASIEDHFTRFNEISPGVYVGSRIQNEEAACALVAAGFKSVLSFQGGDFAGSSWFMKKIISRWEKGETPEQIQSYRKQIEDLGLRFLSRPIDSLRPVSPVTAENVADSVVILSDPDLRPIYATCAHGVDRSLMVRAFYRVVVERWTAEEAYREWVQSGHDWFRQIFTGNLDRYFWRATTGRVPDRLWINQFVGRLKRALSKMSEQPAGELTTDGCQEELAGRSGIVATAAAQP